MIRKIAHSYPISIFMAGDISRAIECCRAYCDAMGFCVTVTPTTYVYTGGQEAGFIIGLINYPRFPSAANDLFDRAVEVAEKLRSELYQDSYSIQTPSETRWFSRRPEDN